MFTWKSKKEDRKRKNSHTDGKQKGGNCIASPFAKFCAKRSRAYKHHNYKTQLLAWNKINKG